MFLQVFSCADIVYSIDVAAGMCWSVYAHLGQKIKSRLEIVGVSVEVLMD